MPMIPIGTSARNAAYCLLTLALSPAFA